MKNYSKVSKAGIIISAFAVLITSIDILFHVIKGTAIGSEIGLFCSTVAIFCSNIAIAESKRKRNQRSK